MDETQEQAIPFLIYDQQSKGKTNFITNFNLNKILKTILKKYK